MVPTHIADIDGDGRLELRGMRTDLDDGSLCVFEIDGSMYDPHTTRMDWPKIRRRCPRHRVLPVDRSRGDYDEVDGGAPTLRLAPNPVPADGRITLFLPAGGNGEIEVFRVDGGRVSRRLLDSTREVSVRSMIGDRCASGIYFIRWNAEGRARLRSERLLVLGP